MAEPDAIVAPNAAPVAAAPPADAPADGFDAMFPAGDSFDSAFPEKAGKAETRGVQGLFGGMSAEPVTDWHDYLENTPTGRIVGAFGHA
ncbi:MAG: hypothetical protein EBY18_23530, partial [Alphaproteobacteria bacterium]|nr:hypothetical protein [Alphaproteobacteria bacterium]